MVNERPPRRPPAFLPAAPAVALLPNLHRRPRATSRNLQRNVVVQRRRAPTMQSAHQSDEAASSQASPDWLSGLDGGGSGSAAAGAPTELSGPSSGFALADAAPHAFAALAEDASPFERGGAYTIFDGAGAAQYMGYSKNVAAKLAFHARLQPALCDSFRVYMPSVPPELISPDLLESVLEYWVRELGDVPRGNAVDRALWETERPLDRKSEQASPQRPAMQTPSTATPPPQTGAATAAAAGGDDVPVRERSTARRTATQRGADSVGAGVGAATGFGTGVSDGGTAQRQAGAGGSGGWAASDEDYVEVEVDPLDPFSATKRRRTTRETWDEFDEVETREDWYPILMIAGFAGLVWLFGVLGNALPAATPVGGL